MTKIKQSDFAVEAATPLERPKSRAEKLADFRNQNEGAYQAAQKSCCMCSPSRAEMLLIDQYEGLSPID